MLKFALRRNLIYPLQYLIWTVLRDVESIVVGYFLEFESSSINVALMFMGEFLAGLIIYLYQKQFSLNNKKEKSGKLLTKEFTKTEPNFIKDGKIKIIFLLFSIGFYDFVQFILTRSMSTMISVSFERRLEGTFTIATAFFYYFVLRSPIFKHQFYSLVAIGICVLIVIITEFFFQEFNIFLTYGQFIIQLLLILFIEFIATWLQLVEKYLFEYDELNPFFVLMIEGIFGLIYSFIYSFVQNPFDGIIQFKKNSSTSKFVILILSFVLFIFLSGAKNAFRVLTIKIYSPITSTFIEYIFTPFYLIYYFASGEDFISYSSKQANYAYFIINLIISFIMTFLGSVYSELLILYCCGLEHDTYSQVKKRADDEIMLSGYNEKERESVSPDYFISMKDLE